MFKHKNFRKMFSAYLDGEINSQQQQTVISHLEQCASCRKEFNTLQQLERCLKTWKEQDICFDLKQIIARNYKQKQDNREVTQIKSTKKLFVGVTAAGLASLFILGIVLHMHSYVQHEFQGRLQDASDKIGVERPVLLANLDNTAVAESSLQKKEADDFRLRQEDSNSESCKRIYENRFLEVINNPLSTFSIDVDNAAYANMRRFINNKQLPPPDSICIEELVNYFDYDYQQPQDDVPFSITTEIANCPWNPEHDIVLIGLQGRQIPAEKLPPSNLVFLLDVSGSMNEPNKLPLLKNAFKILIRQLQSQDRVAIVVYAGAAGVVLDSTSGSNKDTIIEALDWLNAGGSTAGGTGIKRAYQIAEANFIKGGNNRVILATDGDFNVGVSGNTEMVRLIEQERQKGIFLTVLGLDMGNYQDRRLEKIADKGNGKYYYIDTLGEAQKVFERDLKRTLFTIAGDVKIQIEFNPAKIKAYRHIGYENRLLTKEDFNNDTNDAAELAAGHSVTTLYEIIYSDSKEVFSNVDKLGYQEVAAKGSADLFTVKLRYRSPDDTESKLITSKVTLATRSNNPSENFLFATAVAEYGLLLSNSEYKANASFESVIKRAKQAKGDDPFGCRSEFIQLVETAQALSGLPR